MRVNKDAKIWVGKASQTSLVHVYYIWLLFLSNITLILTDETTQNVFPICPAQLLWSLAHNAFILLLLAYIWDYINKIWGHGEWYLFLVCIIVLYLHHLRNHVNGVFNLEEELESISPIYIRTKYFYLVDIEALTANAQVCSIGITHLKCKVHYISCITLPYI